MSELLQRVEGGIQTRRLLLRGQKILVAVSGGVDSMVLLHVLHSLAPKNRWRMCVAHFNHRLRGRASDADERLVRKAAVEMKLPFVAGCADVKRFAEKSKLSVEMAARKLRHEFLGLEAAKRKIKTIALAHHADDQVELFFLRLLRGAGGGGLAGMKWSSPSPANGKITLVRPLLDSPKSDLLAFARENKIRFRDDATNFSSDFPRNRIRNELLPLLRKRYQPGLDKAVLRLMEIVSAESDFVGEVARSAVSGLRLDPVRPQAERYTKLPVAIQRRVLQLQLAELGVSADFDLIESLRQSAGRVVSIATQLSVSRNAAGAVELRSHTPAKFHADKLAVDLSGRAGESDFCGGKFQWQSRVRRGSQGKLASAGAKSGREFFDADNVGRKIILRHWRPGDRFQPIGLNSAAKLQDLFVNAKIPRARRRNLVVAEAAVGEIFWVEGLRIGENFKLTPRTERQLIWRWRRGAA